MKNLVLLLLLVTVSTLSFGKIYDIRDYGAIGDSLTINTKAIQKAIDECSAEGGGIVPVSYTHLTLPTIA